MTRISSNLRNAARRRSRSALAAATLAVAATAATAALSTAALAPQAGQRVDMKVLLLANSAGDPDITAWEDNLKREGTPYDRINGATAAALTAGTLADGERAKYQAVIVAGANGTLASGRPDGFSDAEWVVLRAFEKKFAIRQLNVNAVPGPPLGLGFATATGQLDGASASVTTEGLAQFSNLAGAVPFENLDATLETNGYGATPCNGADAPCAASSYETLVRGSSGVFNNASLVGIAKMKDEREEMNATFSSNQFQVHSQILRHAMLSWVTGGVFIGRDRSYLSVDVDDVFLPDDRWNATTNTTPQGTAAGQQDLRMTAADVQRLVAFQNDNNVKFNLLFNAAGVEEAGGPSEPLTAALLASKAQFPWVNHTFSHPNLATASQATIQAEITQNNQFAQTNALPGYNPAALVTGEHSGIGTSNPVTAANPNMSLALNAMGVTSVGADNSRETGQRQLGNALTLPRYPMNVFYNVATWDDQLDEYDWLYLSSTAAPAGRGNCTNSATTTCFATPVTQAQFIDREASAVVRRMMGNDPRPHYAHQTNIMAGSAEPDVPPGTGPVSNRGDGILYAVMGEALRRYRAYFDVPFDQPGMVALTQQLRRQIAWSSTTSGQVNGYIQDGKVNIVSTVSRDVPVTGTTVGDVNGGQRSGWLSVNGGTTTLELEEPRNTAAPVISGQSTVGSTLTATVGTFTGTPTPVITSRQWQRRTSGNGQADGPWTSIPAATSATYVVTAEDVGRQLRFVTTAANRHATWGMGISAPLTVGGPGTPNPPVVEPEPTKPVGSVPPPATVVPGGIAVPPGKNPIGKPRIPARPAFTCSVKRAARVRVSCVVRNTSGGLKTARIRATRGTKVVGTASGKVRAGNRVPTLQIKRSARRQNTRITITVKLANGRSRSMTRTLKL